jgi:hypothetical protein
MNTAEMKRIVEASPRFKARIVGVFYLVTILTGGIVLFVHGRLSLIRLYRCRLLYRCDGSVLSLKPVTSYLSLLAASWGAA